MDPIEQQFSSENETSYDFMWQALWSFYLINFLFLFRNKIVTDAQDNQKNKNLSQYGPTPRTETLDSL